MEPREIDFPERLRRLKQASQHAWETTGHTAQDPGLRDVFDSFPRLPIRLIACPMNKEANHGGLLRIAEAFRLEQVDLSPELDGKFDKAGSRGSFERQAHRWIYAEQAIEEAKRDGYQVAALTIHDRAVAFQNAPLAFPLALVLGSELYGIPPEIEAMCDLAVAIPMYGLITSLNVTVAAGIAVYEAVSHLVQGQHEYEPARNASRQLLGLPIKDYRATDA